MYLTFFFPSLLAIAYFGPTNQALPYFENLGYYCPSHINPAEFLRMLPCLHPTFHTSWSLLPGTENFIRWCNNGWLVGFFFVYQFAEEVVESAGSKNTIKFLRHPPSEGSESDDDNDDDGGHHQSPVKWLANTEFVAHYRQSDLNKRVLEVIETINSNPGKGDQTQEVYYSHGVCTHTDMYICNTTNLTNRRQTSLTPRLSWWITVQKQSIPLHLPANFGSPQREHSPKRSGNHNYVYPSWWWT